MAEPLRVGVLELTIHRHQTDTTPAHHVTTTPVKNWSSYFTDQATSRMNFWSKPTANGDASTVQKIMPPGNVATSRIGFKNPWPSWYKPTQKQVWENLEWGEDQDPCIDLAASHISNIKSDPVEKSQASAFNRRRSTIASPSRSNQASQLLHIVAPDFTFDPSTQRCKTTWLGHAGMLVQLPPLEKEGRPIRCVFDPIFSTRASPSQVAGPIRSYKPPCKIETLPPIDVYMISHNHFDHLDHETMMTIWKLNKSWIRFLVPLGNRQWFIDCGIDEDRVTELDWWDSVELSYKDTPSLKITCTPSQHNSGRSGLDTDASLWSSWYLEHPLPTRYRIFFAGDTGFQFHSSPAWPPRPSPHYRYHTHKIAPLLNGPKPDWPEDEEYPSCPAFSEIAQSLGSPNLLLLPIAVGATFSFLRSYMPLPDSISPFPRHSQGLTAANHMPPWDAVRVLKAMTENFEKENVGHNQRPPVAIAMHWGTFVPDRVEVLKTLGQLEWACDQHDVRFGRYLQDMRAGDSREPVFLALNHGQSVNVSVV